MKCRKCGTQTTRKTHDGPKAGKTTWYAWWFRCAGCRHRGVRCGDDCTANGSVPWRRILVPRSFAGRVCAGEESPETELRVAAGLCEGLAVGATGLSV